jgi:hypothetical protein
MNVQYGITYALGKIRGKHDILVLHGEPPRKKNEKKIHGGIVFV